MGGSFNPPHAAHAMIAREALKRLRLDRLWWVVTPGNPLKANSGLPSQAIRMRACRALASHPRMEVTGFESELGSPYTAVTLAFLRKRYPATRFVWVMGADNLAQFHRWQDWEDIARSWPIAVIDRPGWRLEALAAQGAQSLSPRRLPEAQAASLARCRPPVWSFLTSRLSPLSSTALRAEAAAEHKAAALPRRTVPLKRG